MNKHTDQYYMNTKPQQTKSYSSFQPPPCLRRRNSNDSFISPATLRPCNHFLNFFNIDITTSNRKTHNSSTNKNTKQTS